MPINFPVPIYFRTETEGTNTDGQPVKRMSGVSPGTTDSTTTQLTAPSLLNLSRGFLIGEQSQHASAYNLNVYRNKGWVMTGAQAVAAGIIPAATDGYKIQAGTWTLTMHASRPGGLLTRNVTLTCSVDIFKISTPTSGGALQLIASGNRSITVTTTETAFTLSMTGVEVEFEPGDCLYIQIHWEAPAAVTADISRLHTNSTTGTRLTAIPQYTKIQYTTGSASGVSTPTASLSQVLGTVASGSGSSTPQAVVSQFQQIAGSASGSSDVQANTAKVIPTVGTASGLSTPQAVIAQVQQVTGSTSGSSTPQARVANIQAVVATSSGLSTVTGRTSIVLGTVGSASGQSTVTGRTAIVLGTVGTINIGAGNVTPIIRRRKIVVYDE